MTTIRKIIERVDRKIENPYDDVTKLEWIAQLDGKIAMNVMLMDMAELEQFNYSYPDDLDKQPLVKFPYDELYDLWIAARIDAQNQEWDRYANSVEYYNAFYGEFVNWFLSTYQPGQGRMEPGTHRPGTVSYYITAYGLAVMQGYKGTLDEWLVSLSAYGQAVSQGFEGTMAEWLASLKGEKGDKGDKGNPGAYLSGLTVTMLDADAEPYATLSGTEDAPIMNLGIPKMAGDFLELTGGNMLGQIQMNGFKVTGLPSPAADSDAVNLEYLAQQMEQTEEKLDEKLKDAVTYSTGSPKAAGMASPGEENAASRGDHVHPAQTTVSGNAGTATKLATARTLRTNLASTATADFDGSANATPGVTGTLPVGNGGTGKATHTANAVLTGNGTSAVKNVATESGALYATEANGAPKFGVLPIAQGGTGKTTAAAALAALGGISTSGITSYADVKQLYSGAISASGTTFTISRTYKAYYAMYYLSDHGRWYGVLIPAGMLGEKCGIVYYSSYTGITLSLSGKTMTATASDSSWSKAKIFGVV